MSPEQVEDLVTRMTRPVFIYRMNRARLEGRGGSEAQRREWQRRVDQAHTEIEQVMVDLFGPDLEDEQPDDLLGGHGRPFLWTWSTVTCD